MKGRVGQSVVASCAPPSARHGYRGHGYIGQIESIEGKIVTVRFGKNGTRKFHENNLSYLKIDSRKGA